MFYLIPRYLNCTNWNTELAKFEDFLQELNPTNYCIVGDLNARISDVQVLDTNFLIQLPNIRKSRCSKDKVINNQGKKLIELIEQFGGIVLNGRAGKDVQGEYSFCGSMGSSVIDYCICSYSLLQYVDDFAIASKPYSDHMPLCLKIKTFYSDVDRNDKPALQRLHWNNKFAGTYVEKLSMLASSIDLHTDVSVDELASTLTNKVKQAYETRPNKKFFEPKKKWFDWKCARYRTAMLRNLRIYRKEHTFVNKLRYSTARAKFLKICDNKKLEFYNKNLDQLNKVKCSSDWWQLSNSLKSRSHTVKGNLTANDFKSHFSALLNNTDNIPSISWAMPYLTDSVLDSPIEYCEISSVIKSLKLNKAPGQDGISYEFYRFAPDSFINEILSVFNKIFLQEKIPSSFQKSILIPLFKKGDVSQPSNYRGLSLMDTLCKIFNTLLLNRLTEWIEYNKVLNEFQAGFRKHYSTVDNIFNLVNIVNLNSLNNKFTYAFFVDFSCAFDTIPRNCLFYKLSCLGLSSKLIRILQFAYEKTESRIWDGTSFSDPFSVNLGVKQGCILSPILFSLYVNDLADALPHGVNVADINVKILLYADDIVILSDSQAKLQQMIDALFSYCTMWCLKVNLNKSKIVVFRSGPRISSNLNWKFGNDCIDIVNSYKYLGIDITYNLSFKKHLQNKLAASKLAINSTWSKYINHPKISKHNKLRIFHAASRSIMLYAAQVWGYQKYDEVEKLFRFFIKKMLYLPTTTPNYMLHLETGLDPLYISTLRLHFCYINKALNMNRNRLPRILAETIIAKNEFWAKEWTNLQQILNFTASNSNQPLCSDWKPIIALLINKERENNVLKATTSQHHDLYSQLNYSVTPLLASNYSSRITSLIIKARGGMLDLNARAFRINSISTCALCNLEIAENTYHFLGVCPIYNGFRLQYFGKAQLGITEVLNILNGSDFNNMYKYVEISLKYRKLIINEFET